MNYQEINSRTFDRWIEEGWEWGIPVSHETYMKALAGEWDVLLTPVKPVPHSWFGDLRGKKLLGLASGGGQQMPVFSALGAVCTVLDYSEKQLESERLVARREGYSIEIVKADMTKPLPFEDESFDIIFNPVSLCYIEKVEPVFRECARVLKKGGVLMCGLDNGVNYMFNDDETRVENTFPFNPLKNPDQMKSLIEDDCGIQFSHSLPELLGGQIDAGFMLTDMYDDINSEGFLAEHNIPSFLAVKAVKMS